MFTDDHRFQSRFAARVSVLIQGLVCAAVMSACGPTYHAELPATESFPTVDGKRIARVITHFHTPYSFDACDKKGLVDDQPDATCVSHFRQALCSNRIDAIYLTDHPDAMARFPFSDLLFKTDSDDASLSADGSPFAVHMGACANGHRPWISAGFEARVMALGMTKHLSGTADARSTDYNTESRDLVERLRTESDAIIAIPHPESRSVETLRSLHPDLIEIYNIHANLDPKIRRRDLGEPPFENLASLLTYIVDPYDGMLPDFAFMSFFKLFKVHFDRWNTLLAAGERIGGIVASDSHENVFSQLAADGERLDGHRRMTRFISNHVLTDSLDPSDLKAALRKGRSWLVVEGLGTPADFTFTGAQAATTLFPGDAARASTGTVTLSASVSGLHSASPTDEDANPDIRLELHRVTADGAETSVASGNSSLGLSTSTAGAYRVHAWIRPRHLAGFLGPFDSLAEREYPWIVTNPIWVQP